MGKVVGIDLGTTESLISYCDGRTPRVLVNLEGSRLTPSVVAFQDDGTRLVGRAAKGQAAINPTRTLSSVKRLMGRRRCELTEEEKILPYKIVGDLQDMAQVEIDGKRYYPSEISAMVLQDLKKSAEKALGEPISECVITTPARFDDSARQATKVAAEVAGFRVLRVLSEPTSAALAYGLDSAKDEKIIVVDCGGGTHDVSCIAVGGGVFEVIATAGDLILGGDNFDSALFGYVVEEFKKSSGIDLSRDKMAAQRAIEACEKAKCDLSTLPQTTINLPYITASASGPVHLSQTITRAKFEQLCEPLFARFRAPIMQALADAKWSPNQVQNVIIVGGSSRIPKLQEICKEIFGREPHQGVNPDEAIALGAAITGSLLSGGITDLILLDITPLSLCLETQGGLATTIIARNTTIPTSKSEVFSTASDNQPAVDIHVLQGERKMASGNRTLGRFQMTGIPIAPRGVPQIEILFDLDANGILKVTAKDKLTGKEHQVEIKNSSGLDKSDVERMTREAKQYEQEDLLKFELIEARNEADHLVFETEKFMRENTKAISAAVHEKVKAAIDALRTVMGVGTKEQIKSGIDALEIANKAMYEQFFAGQQAKPTTPPNSNDNIDTAKFTLI